MESMDTSMDSRGKWNAGKYGIAEVAGIQVRMELQRGKWYAGKYGDADVGSSGKYGIAESNLLVDIPFVKGKWPYRYVSELPLRSNHLPVDIPSVKGKWPYRYVSELPLRVRMN
ncbi:hypothetical protein T09_12984 [Trichinella sp. T9]|nr:hypothetical protein T09_12984 [Trichinella sp. T9]